MIKVIAIDDEPLALSIVEGFCSQIDYIDLQKTFIQPNEGLKYLEKYPVDLLFLDVHMPALNGVDLYRNINQNTLVVFCTAHSEYAVEGFNLNAVDYLLKPFTFKRFLKACDKAKDYFSAIDVKSTSHIFLRADGKLHKINLDLITSIEALDDYLKIHLLDQKTLVVRMTMKAMLEKLPPSKFVRVHRSFIVPFDKVQSLTNKVINLKDKIIPIGKNYEEDVMFYFNK